MMGESEEKEFAPLSEVLIDMGIKEKPKSYLFGISMDELTMFNFTNVKDIAVPPKLLDMMEYRVRQRYDELYKQYGYDPKKGKR